MPRILIAIALSLLTLPASRADFLLTGDPSTDLGWKAGGLSMANGSYVRNLGNFNFYQYTTEFRITGGQLTTMLNPWSYGDKVLGLGGVFSSPMTPADLGWPAITGPAQNAQVQDNTRINAKFGTNAPDNIYSASTTAPNLGNGNGSHSGGNGGLGSILISIGTGKMNDNAPNTPNTLIRPVFNVDTTTSDRVYQWQGVSGNNGLDLVYPGGVYQEARYIYGVDANGFLATWEVLLNVTLVSQYAGATPNSLSLLTGGSAWVQTASFGPSGTNNTDGLMKSDVYFEAPAPPALCMALLGGLVLLRLRRM